MQHLSVVVVQRVNAVADIDTTPTFFHVNFFGVHFPTIYLNFLSSLIILLLFNIKNLYKSIIYLNYW